MKVSRKAVKVGMSFLQPQNLKNGLLTYSLCHKNVKINGFTFFTENCKMYGTKNKLESWHIF